MYSASFYSFLSFQLLYKATYPFAMFYDPAHLAEKMRRHLTGTVATLSEIQLRRAADLTISRALLPERVEIPDSQVVTVVREPNHIKASRISPKNFSVSVKNILTLATSIAFTVASTISDPWLIPFAVILLVQELRQQFSMSFDEKAALVLYSFAMCARDNLRPTAITVAAKRIARPYGITFSREGIERELKNLVKLGILKKERNGYTVVEKIIFKRR